MKTFAHSCADPKPKKRKRKKPPIMPPGRWGEVMLRDNSRCQNPNCKTLLGHFNMDSILELHHITKRSQGVDNGSDNLIVLCKACHNLIHVSGKLKITGKYPGVIFIDI